MNRLHLVAASLALTAAGLAAAQAATPGAEQLAARLHLNPDAYTETELNVIDEALRTGDTTTANFYIKGENRAALPAAVTPGRAQIAASLRLNPADYSLAELTVIDSARKAGNTDLAAFYTSGRNREIRGGLGEVSQGKAQLAAALGLNPADYTLTQLSARYLALVTN